MVLIYIYIYIFIFFHNKSLTPLEIDNNKYADVSTVFLQSSSGQKRKEKQKQKQNNLRKTVETSAYLLLSISSGVNDLL